MDIGNEVVVASEGKRNNGYEYCGWFAKNFCCQQIDKHENDGMLQGSGVEVEEVEEEKEGERTN